jgi:hypothetical protein
MIFHDIPYSSNFLGKRSSHVPCTFLYLYELNENIGPGQEQPSDNAVTKRSPWFSVHERVFRHSLDLDQRNQLAVLQTVIAGTPEFN